VVRLDAYRNSDEDVHDIYTGKCILFCSRSVVYLVISKRNPFLQEQNTRIYIERNRIVIPITGFSSIRFAEHPSHQDDG